MPFSTDSYKQEVFSHIKSIVDSASRILDVGPGIGTYGKGLEGYNVDAVEVFKPYIETYNLTSIYRNVYNENILNFDWTSYDYIVLGDILEHIETSQAQKLIRDITQAGKKCIVAVPYSFEQGESHGNVYETHLQPDLTKEVMLSRYPELSLLVGDDGYGYYINYSMKKLIILHSYPNTGKQLDVLSECLDALNKTDYDIMLVSHYPVPAEVYKKATYYLFDEDNEMLPEGEFPPYYYDIDGFQATINLPGHTLPITRSMKKSITFARALKYDFFWFMEADCVFSDRDLVRFDALRKQMFDEDKYLIYFKPKGFVEHRFGSQVYETLIFGGSPVYFLAKWTPPATLKEWRASDMSHMLEYDFYVKYRDSENDYLIIDDHSSTYFDSSRINIFRYGAFTCEALYHDDNSVVIFRYNTFYNQNTYRTVTRVNGEVVAEAFFCKGCYAHSTHELNGSVFEIDIYEDDKYSYTKTFVLTKENLELFKKKGTFVTNKKLQHFYRNIGEDWFTYPNLYKSVVEKFDNAHFVEVGSWKGRSASYMGVEIINSGKNIKFDCVDTWNGAEEHTDPNSQFFNKELLEDKDWLYNLFLENTKPVKDVVNPIRLDSISASKLYEDNSLDFVFVDAAHDYENVCADIKHWLPKVKSGGVLAGHDFHHPPIVQAVNELLGEGTYTADEDCWIYHKP